MTTQERSSEHPPGFAQSSVPLAKRWDRDPITPEDRLRAQHRHGVHTDCDRETCAWWQR